MRYDSYIVNGEYGCHQDPEWLRKTNRNKENIASIELMISIGKSIHTEVVRLKQLHLEKKEDWDLIKDDTGSAKFHCNKLKQAQTILKANIENLKYKPFKDSTGIKSLVNSISDITFSNGPSNQLAASTLNATSLVQHHKGNIKVAINAQTHLAQTGKIEDSIKDSLLETDKLFIFLYLAIQEQHNKNFTSDNIIKICNATEIYKKALIYSDYYL